MKSHPRLFNTSETTPPHTDGCLRRFHLYHLFHLKFSDLALDERILDAVAEKGYETPTPIQQGAIPKILDGNDVMGVAQTGTGKTAAFSIPTLQILTEKAHTRRGRRAIKGLILTPTRELAIQIAENLEDYGK